MIAPVAPINPMIAPEAPTVICSCIALVPCQRTIRQLRSADQICKITVLTGTGFAVASENDLSNGESYGTSTFFNCIASCVCFPFIETKCSGSTGDGVAQWLSGVGSTERGSMVARTSVSKNCRADGKSTRVSKSQARIADDGAICRRLDRQGRKRRTWHRDGVGQ